MKVKISKRSKHKLPEYTTDKSAGMDLRTNIDKDIAVLNYPGIIDAD